MDVAVLRVSLTRAEHHASHRLVLADPLLDGLNGRIVVVHRQLGHVLTCPVTGIRPERNMT